MCCVKRCVRTKERGGWWVWASSIGRPTIVDDVTKGMFPIYHLFVPSSSAALCQNALPSGRLFNRLGRLEKHFEADVSEILCALRGNQSASRIRLATSREEEDREFTVFNVFVKVDCVMMGPATCILTLGRLKSNKWCWHTRRRML